MIGTLRTFTDAIMSIVATIMVLEIPLPKLINAAKQTYDLSDTLNSLLIFFVSFLVVVSFYFEFVKFFKRTHKITGWQVFAYVFFLMALSLFPFMTQVDNSVHPAYFTIIYIVYILGISRYASVMCRRIDKVNHYVSKKPRRRGISWDGILVAILAIALAIFTKGSSYGVVLLYLPVRSLISSVVYDDEDYEE